MSNYANEGKGIENIFQLVEQAEEHDEGIVYFGGAQPNISFKSEQRTAATKLIMIMSKETYDDHIGDAKHDGQAEGWQAAYDKGYEDGEDNGFERGLDEARNRI